MPEELYSFIIVDDEPIIREGVRDNIPWSELGFRYAGGCGNGVEAMDLVEQENPDVIMTDINMPFMDGLSLSEWVLQHRPLTKVLILSGYDDFEYAQRALKLKVYDFILKPVTPKEFRETLGALRRRLDEERENRRNMELLKAQLRTSLPLLRERLLNALVSNARGDQEGIGERLAYLGVGLPADAGAYQVIALDLDAKRSGEEAYLDLIAEGNAVDEFLPDDYPRVIFNDPSGRTVLVSWEADASRVYAATLGAVERLLRAVPQALARTASAGIGDPVPDLWELSSSYREAVQALEYGRLRGGGRAFSYRELLGRDSRERPPTSNWGRRIATAIKAADREEAERAVDAMVDDCLKGAYEPGFARATLRMALASMVQACEDLRIPESEVLSEGGDPFSLLSSLRSLEEARTWFKSIATRVLEALSEHQEDFARTKAREGALYMERRFAEPDLSLASLCRDLCVSSSYFSLIFKKHQGATFVERLTELRITKAKELLRSTAMKTYEVAEAVGYRDPHYFSLIFRKTAGETPTAYRAGAGQ